MALDKEVAGLLRFPMIALSVIFLLWMMRLVLGFDLTELSWGDVSVKFKAQERAVAVAGIDTRVDEALARIDALEKVSTNARPGAAPSEKDQQAAQSAQIEASQTVSDSTASLATKRDSNDTIFKNSTGFMWVGNHYANERKWTSLKLATEGNGEGVPADQLTIGSVYYTKANLVVRSAMPANDASYFKAIPVSAIVPTGNKVKVTGKPQGIDRGFTTQYWVPVEVVQ